MQTQLGSRWRNNMMNTRKRYLAGGLLVAAALSFLGTLLASVVFAAGASNVLIGILDPVGDQRPGTYRMWFVPRPGDTATAVLSYTGVPPASNRTFYSANAGNFSSVPWAAGEIVVAKVDKDNGSGRGRYAVTQLTLSSGVSSQSFPNVTFRDIPTPSATVASGAVSVSWAAAVDGGSGNILGYDVYRSTTGVTPTPPTAETGWTKINDATVAGTSYIDNAANSTPDPVAGATYFYAIKILYRGHTSAVPRRTDYLSANPGSVVYPAAPPTVTGITPNSGMQGTSVSVSNLAGAGFQAGATVVLSRTGQSDIAMTGITVVSATQIRGTLAIPPAAVTGTWDVQVTNTDGQRGTGTGLFTINPSLSVTSIAPNTAQAGTTVSITNLAGTGFSGSPTVVLRRVGQTDISMTGVTVVSATQITGSFAIPITAVTGAWDVVVTVGGTSATGTGLFTVTAAPAPTVSNISPTSGVRGTILSSVTVTGTNYFAGAQVVLRRAGSADISMSGETVGGGGTTITGSISIPSGAAVGSWNVVVTNADSQTGTGVGLFSVMFPAPIVVGITPTSGRQGQTITVTSLSGGNFRAGATAALVSAGQLDILFTTTNFLSAVNLTGNFTIPFGAQTGIWNVRVTNDDGQSATGGIFSVTAAPSIVLTPTSRTFSGRAGDPNPPTQTFTVTNPPPGGGTLNWTGTEVNDSGVEGADVIPWLAFAPVAANNNNTTVTISINITGLSAGTYTGSIRIRDAAANNSPQNVAVTLTLSAPLPTVLSIAPTSGTRGTTVPVTIAGANFQVGAAARLFRAGSADIPMTSVVVNGAGNSITANVAIPASAALAAWSVAVDNPDGGTNSLTDGFTVIAQAPTVISISPSSAARGAAISATVIGTNFQAGAQVVLRRGGVEIAMTGEVVNGAGDQITGSIAIPADAATGTWDVIVTNPDSQSATGAGLFTVTLPGPTVLSISPTSGTRGTTVPVTIAGANFQVGAAARLFRAGSADIPMTSVIVNGAGNSITASILIPSGAALVAWSVAVDNPDGGTSSLADGFTVTAPAPTVVSITPSSGTQGVTVSITNLSGTGFLAGATVLLRRTGQTDILMTGVTVVSDTQITGSFAIPSGAATGAWDVRVTNTDSQSGTGAGLFTINAPLPTVSSISPTSGTRGTTVPVTIAGANFQAGAVARLFRAGSANINMTSVVVNGAGNSITASIAIPASAALGAWSVAVDNPDGGTSSLTDGFTVTAPAPTVTSISPSSAARGATVSATVIGTNFQAGAQVVLRRAGSADVLMGGEVVNAAGDQITGSIAIATDAATGVWDVIATNPDAQSGTGAGLFTVTLPGPTITSISPTSGTRGTSVSVTIAGANFQAGAQARLFRSGSADIAMTGEIVNAAGTSITASVALPSGAVLAAWSLAVDNTDGGTTSLADAFTVTAPAPTVTSITPTSGTQGATVSITNLSGTGFLAGATILLRRTGQTDISMTGVTVVSDTQITGSIAIPANAATGAWDVRVTNTDSQSGTGTGLFTINPPAPTISSISPNTGTQGSAVSVTITGTGFLSGATAKIWRTGSADINMTSLTVASSTSITASIPIPSAAAAGLWNVTVTNPGGQEANLLDGFTVIATVSVSGISVTRVTDTAGGAVQLSWTRTPSGPVDIYTVSGASGSSSAVFTTTPGSWTLEFANVTGTSQDDATEVGQGTQKYYKIVPAGTTLTTALLQVDVVGKFDLLVGPAATQPERFFVSLPLVPSSTAIANVLGTQAQDDDFVVQYDINRNVTTGSLYSGGTWVAFPGSPRLDNLQPGVAYGYQAGTSRSVTIVGSVRTTDATRTLTGGATAVNWVGNNFPVPAAIASAGLNGTTVGLDPTLAATLYQFDANALTISDLDGIAVHNAAAGWVNGGLSSATTMQLRPGRGYMLTDPTSGSITWTQTRPF